MKAAVLLLFLTVLLTFPSASQQLPQHSQYMWMPGRFNPAWTGSQDHMTATLWHRNQWTSLEGGPVITFAHVEMPLSMVGIRGGAGLSVASDKARPNRDVFLTGSYAYHAPLGKGTLGLGLSAGLAHRASKPFPNDSETGGEDSEAPVTTQSEEKESAIDLSLGTRFQTGNFYVGLSVLHLTEPTLSPGDSLDRLKRVLYLTSGYTWQLNHPLWAIRPSLLLCHNGVHTSVTGSVLAMYDKRMWGGFSYGHDALTLLLGISLYSGLQIGYAYDLAVPDTKPARGGSHEFMVRYHFRAGKDRNTGKYKSVRYL